MNREELRSRIVAMLDRARKNPPSADAETWAAVEQGMAATWATVEQGIDVILDETERMVDAVIDRVVKAEALRPVVRSALRADLVSWPTPWVRPRANDADANGDGDGDANGDDIDDDGDDIDDDGNDIIDGDGNSAEDRRQLARAGQERRAREPYPALAALEAVAVDLAVAQRVNEWKAEGAPMWGSPTGPFFPPFFRWGSDRTRVADLAWSSIGNETERHSALDLAVALARLDLDSLDRVFVSTDNIGTGIATIDGVGPVYVATVALIAHLYQQEFTPERLAHHAARAFLDECKDDTAKCTEAETLLSRAVVDRLPTRSDDDKGEDVEGVYSRDEALAVILAGTGDVGRKLAGDVRQKSKAQTREQNAARWLLGFEPLRVPRLLARALWVDVVRPRLEQLAETHVALTRVVHIDVLDMLRPGQTFRDGFILDEDGRQRMMFTRTQALDVPTVEMGAIPRLLSRGVEMLGSIQAHRTVRHLVVEGHRRVMTGEADPRVLTYPGGWSTLAKAAGVTEPEEARALIVALAHAPHALPGREFHRRDGRVVTGPQAGWQSARRCHDPGRWQNDRTAHSRRISHPSDKAIHRIQRDRLDEGL
jgi:hypothetical protein